MSSEPICRQLCVLTTYLDSSFNSSLPTIGFQNITHENVTIDISASGGIADGSKSVISGSRDANKFDESRETSGIHGKAMNDSDFFDPRSDVIFISSSKMSIGRRHDAT